MIIYILKLCFLQARQPYPNIYILIFHQAALCRSGSALRVIMHLFSAFSPTTHRASILPSSASLLGNLHFFSTQSLTECAPFLRTYRIPSASLWERSYASVAPQPLPAASTFPFPSNFTFSQNFLFRAVAQALSNRLLL